RSGDIRCTTVAVVRQTRPFSATGRSCPAGDLSGRGTRHPRNTTCPPRKANRLSLGNTVTDNAVTHDKNLARSPRTVTVLHTPKPVTDKVFAAAVVGFPSYRRTMWLSHQRGRSHSRPGGTPPGDPPLRQRPRP